jgi:hypothetical protein
MDNQTGPELSYDAITLNEKTFSQRFCVLPDSALSDKSDYAYTDGVSDIDLIPELVR